MRKIEEIKQLWDTMHTISNEGALTGGKYEETVDCLFVTDKLKFGDHVLEIGTGLGYVTKSLKNHGMIVSALDISTIGLDKVKEFCENIYSVEEIESLPSDYFDIIICINTIQHIPTFLLEKELPHIIRSLKPTGIFAVQFVSACQIEDSGIDSEELLKLGWDSSIGHYARTPQILEKIINKYGGKCQMVSELHKDICKEVNGAFVFHVTK